MYVVKWESNIIDLQIWDKESLNTIGAGTAMNRRSPLKPWRTNPEWLFSTFMNKANFKKSAPDPVYCQEARVWKWSRSSAARVEGECQRRRQKQTREKKPRDQTIVWKPAKPKTRKTQKTLENA